MKSSNLYIILKILVQAIWTVQSNTLWAWSFDDETYLVLRKTKKKKKKVVYENYWKFRLSEAKTFLVQRNIKVAEKSKDIVEG